MKSTWFRKFCLTAVALGPLACATAASVRDYASPEAAVEALMGATRSDQSAMLSRILGPGSDVLIHSGDEVADARSRAQFAAAYSEAHRLEYIAPGRAELLVGREGWPMPIPLVHRSSGWSFDARAGEQEILDRRIGRNEIDVIEVARAYVQAQREYAALSRANSGHVEFAQRFSSHEGTHDGLYWPVQPGAAESPLGPLVAQAQAEGYERTSAASGPSPYHGYYYRILKAQGAHAPGGAKDYVANGRMVDGFALLAYPAVYGDSGIMTFMVSDDGIVYERNLGPRTATVAPAIVTYDPAAAWRPVKVDVGPRAVGNVAFAARQP